MLKIKNMKVKRSLIYGFSSIITLFLVLLFAAFGAKLYQQSAYERLLKQDVYCNELLLSCRLDAQIAARNVREMVLAADDSARSNALYQRYKEMEADFMEKFQQLQKNNPLNDDTIDQYYAAVQTWDAANQELLATLERKDYMTAMRLIEQKERPALDQMSTTAATFSQALFEKQTETLAHLEQISTILSVIMAVLLVTIILLTLDLTKRIVGSIVPPVEEVHRALMGFSQGHFDIPVNFVSQNELGEMCEAMRTSQSTLKTVVEDECYVLDEMAQGNFDVRMRCPEAYVGGLQPVRQSIHTINQSLSSTLNQIEQGAALVASGSTQVSNGAQDLAQGATEQASSVQELSATIAEIAANAKANSERSVHAMERSQVASDHVAESVENMKEMVHAMGEINSSSEQIGKIIATIENIAFQTNILALNAAVEAARAGTAGKGFAVVADEVRNLAAKSDEAAKATKDLIESSIQSVQEGNAITRRVADSLERALSLSGETNDEIKHITQAIQEESTSIQQVTEGIDQIAAVVQTNSATSEQSAAASQELSDQADMMKDLMSHFAFQREEQQF